MPIAGIAERRRVDGGGCCAWPAACGRLDGSSARAVTSASGSLCVCGLPGRSIHQREALPRAAAALRFFYEPRECSDISSGCILVRSRSKKQEQRTSEELLRWAAFGRRMARSASTQQPPPTLRFSAIPAIEFCSALQASGPMRDSAATPHRVPLRRASAAPPAGLSGSRCRAS